MEKTKEAGIFKRSNGGLKIITTAKCPQTGAIKKVRKSLPKGTTLRQAVLIRDEIKHTVQGEPQHTQQRETLSSYAVAWIERKAPRLKPNTERTYRDILTNAIIPELGTLYADVIRRSDLEEWVTWAEKQTTPDGVAYSDATLMKWWRVLTVLCKDLAADLGLDDPTLRVSRPRSQRKHVREHRTLNADELGRFLTAVRIVAPHRYTEVLMLAYTGLRPGELYALQWSDLDVDREMLTVSASVSGRQLTDTTKTGDAREVYVPEVVLSALMEHRKQMIRDQHRGLSTNLIFPSNTGGVRGPDSLTKPLTRAQRQAKLTVHVSPQVLRRTFNTLLVVAGADRIVLRSQMGHTSEAMTSRYAGVRIEAKREAVTQALGGVSSGHWTPPLDFTGHPPSKTDK